MTPALARLLSPLPGLGSAYQRDLWFGGCALQGAVILVPDEERAASLRRCFLGALRARLSDCDIRFAPVAPKPLVKTAYRGQRVEAKPAQLW